ncbi:hypothetical protein ACRS3X_07900 [Ectopseudomonas hydrolytica]|uniref:hypothetical protein n=1 Tax=Ectopseudomonas hydrolytica TaxID=2493633 RepID=UPI003EDE98B6
MTFVRFALFASLAAAAGCSDQEDKVLDAIVTKSRLVDPASTMIRNVQGKGLREYCLELNTKNKFGGYSGWRRAWTSISETNFILIIENSSTDFDLSFHPILKTANNNLVNNDCGS